MPPDEEYPPDPVFTFEQATFHQTYTFGQATTIPEPEPVYNPINFSDSLWQDLHDLANHPKEDPVAAALLNPYKTTTRFANYVAHRGNTFSFTPAGKPLMRNEHGSWAREGRQESSPAKLARRLLQPKALAALSDKDFEVFANRIKARGALQSGRFELVSGHDVAFWYHGSRYERGCGTLNSSCMQHDHCQDYLGIYVSNPGKLDLLTLINQENRLIGRALVWQLDQPAGVTFLDRIYGDDAAYEAFVAYAIERGWRYRRGGGQIVAPIHDAYVELDWSDTDAHMIATLPNHEFDTYPYMDTMSFYDPDTGDFGNYDHSVGARELVDTGGNAAGGGIECVQCGNELDPDDSDTMTDDGGDLWCWSCWTDAFAQCDHCGAWASREHDDPPYELVNGDVLTLCRYCARSHFRMRDCEGCGLWMIGAEWVIGRAPGCQVAGEDMGGYGHTTYWCTDCLDERKGEETHDNDDADAA